MLIGKWKGRKNLRVGSVGNLLRYGYRKQTFLFGPIKKSHKKQATRNILFLFFWGGEGLMRSVSNEIILESIYALFGIDKI